jgi:hypothetical protein
MTTSPDPRSSLNTLYVRTVTFGNYEEDNYLWIKHGLATKWTS